MIKKYDLINADYIEKNVKHSRKYINQRIREIRLLMFLDGYIVPHGYISKNYFKKYFSGSIPWKKYKKEDIELLKKMGV